MRRSGEIICKHPSTTLRAGSAARPVAFGMEGEEGIDKGSKLAPAARKWQVSELACCRGGAAAQKNAGATTAPAMRVQCKIQWTENSGQ